MSESGDGEDDRDDRSGTEANGRAERAVGGETEERELNEEPADVSVGTTDDSVEPGSPSAENVAFVLLGVLGALYVIARIAGLV